MNGSAAIPSTDAGTKNSAESSTVYFRASSIETMMPPTATASSGSMICRGPSAVSGVTALNRKHNRVE